MPEVGEWDGPVFGELGVLTHDDEGIRIQCHACGRWYKLLGTHLVKMHGIDSDEYRAYFGLNMGTRLAGNALRQFQREHLSWGVKEQQQRVREMPRPELLRRLRIGHRKGSRDRLERIRKARATRLEVQCAVCARTFDTCKSYAEKHRIRTCSRECAAVYRKRINADHWRRLSDETKARLAEGQTQRAQAPILQRLSELEPTALDAVPEPDRRVVEYIYGLSGCEPHTIAETAAHFGVSEPTIYDRRNRVLDQILGEEFRNARLTRSQHIRDRHAARGNRVEVSCTVCGRAYTTRKSYIEKGAGKTCGKECARVLYAHNTRAARARKADEWNANLRASMMRRRQPLLDRLSQVHPDAWTVLSRDDRDMLAYLYGLGDEPHTLEETGERYGLSATTILYRSRRCLALLLPAEVERRIGGKDTDGEETRS